MLDENDPIGKCVLNVHRLVDIIREKQGKPKIDWRERDFFPESVIMETIGNTDVNYDKEGIHDLPPNCQCGCGNPVERSAMLSAKHGKTVWNKFRKGHKPKGAAKGGTRAIHYQLPDEFVFTVKVVDKKEYELQTKVQDKRVFNLLRQVNLGQPNEVTVVYLQEDQIKPIRKMLLKAIEILGMQIAVDSSHDHIALTKT